MSKPLFSFGTSRGGTTFFARILSVNKNVKMASDPLMPLFRAFRNEVVKQKIDCAFDTGKPLDDYYFQDHKLEVFKTIQGSSLDLSFPQGQLQELHRKLGARMDLSAKELVPFVDRIQGKNFFELFQSTLFLMEEAYQSKEGAWCGSNDNWVIEFLPILAESFSEAKFIVVIRDPRGAMASSMKIRDKKPLLVPLMYSFAQHWRKHAAFAWKLMNEPGLKNRLFVFRYENLAKFPEEKITEICDFLGVDFDPSMLVPENFRPISGDKWVTYSNFNTPDNKIYTNSIDSWKMHLDKGTIEFIEFICDPEMSLFGYEPQEYNKEMPSPEVMKFFLEDDKVAKGWRGDHEGWDRERAHHLFKVQCLKEPGNTLAHDVIEKYFLFKEVFDACRRLKKG